MGQRANHAFRIAKRSDAEKPDWTGSENVTVLVYEPVSLGWPRLVVDRRAEHHRVVGVKRLDRVNLAKVYGGSSVSDALGDAAAIPSVAPWRLAYATRTVIVRNVAATAHGRMAHGRIRENPHTES